MPGLVRLRNRQSTPARAWSPHPPAPLQRRVPRLQRGVHAGRSRYSVEFRASSVEFRPADPATAWSSAAPAAPEDDQDARFEGLPEVFIRNAAAVGPRPHPEAVRALTLDICRHRDWTTPDRLRQTALFLKSMEAAVDRAYEMELEPGYFLVAECIRPEEREPALFHSRVA